MSIFRLPALAALVLLTPSLLLAQSERYISGRVAGPDGLGMPGAHVVEVNTRSGAVTDALGIFKLAVPDTGAMVRITYLGYHPVIAELSAEAIRSVPHYTRLVDVRMMKNPSLLAEVRVSADQQFTLLAERGTLIHSFGFVGDRVVALLGRHGERRLGLLGSDMVPVHELPVSKSCEVLFEDCLGLLHLYGTDSVYQVDVQGDELVLEHVFARWQFDRVMAPCRASSPSHLFFGMRDTDDLSARVYGLHRDTKERVHLLGVSDWVQAEEINRRWDMARSRSFSGRSFSGRSFDNGWLERGNEPGGYARIDSWGDRGGSLGGSGLNGRMRSRTPSRLAPFSPFNGFEMIDQAPGNPSLMDGLLTADVSEIGPLGRYSGLARKAMLLEYWAGGRHRPSHFARKWAEMTVRLPDIPVIAMEDEVLVFDHLRGVCLVFGTDGKPQRHFPIGHHELRQWGGQVVADRDGSTVYARLRKGASVLLAPIDTGTGMLGIPIRLADAPFPEQIKVKDGYAYFVVRSQWPEKAERIIRQRL